MGGGRYAIVLEAPGLLALADTCAVQAPVGMVLNSVRGKSCENKTRFESY
jgi:hypothetical protein